MSYDWRNWILAMLLWIGGTSLCSAADWDVSSETISRAFRRTTPLGEEQDILPVYEYLRIDYGDSGAGGIAFHGYGWVRKALRDSEFYEDDPDGELLYAFLTYARPYSPFKVSLGRQHLYAGVADETMDGLRVALGLGSFLSLSAYGGMPVDLEATEGRAGDALYGGRLGLVFASAGQLGISYKSLQDNGEDREQTLGTDLSWSPLDVLLIDGRSTYNLKTHGWREHNYGAQINAGGFELAPVYQHFQYKDYFNTAEHRDNLFRFLFNSDEKLTSWGADVSWKGMETVEIGIRGRHYDYALRETTARYLAGLLTVTISPAVTLGAEAGAMDGETPEDNFQLYRAYAVWSPGKLLGPSGRLSVDVLYQAFDEAVYGVDTALFASLSAGRNFFDDVVGVRASLNYSRDPFFDNDVGGIITIALTY